MSDQSDSSFSALEVGNDGVSHFRSGQTATQIGCAIVEILEASGDCGLDEPGSGFALLFVSPTPFSAWGVIAMWAVFTAALLAALSHLRTLDCPILVGVSRKSMLGEITGRDVDERLPASLA